MLQALALSLPPAKPLLLGAFHPKAHVHVAPFARILPQAPEMGRRGLRERGPWGLGATPRSSKRADALVPVGLEGDQGGDTDVTGEAARKRRESRTRFSGALPDKVTEQMTSGQIRVEAVESAICPRATSGKACRITLYVLAYILPA